MPVPAGGPEAHAVRLTQQEQRVLALLVEGLSNKQIARRLGLSEHGAKRLVVAHRPGAVPGRPG